MREGELAQALDDIWAKSSTRNWIHGRLGVDSGTPEAIDVVGRPGYVVVSMGPNGDLGITVAKDKVGVAKLVFQAIKMRRENGELVIREASAYAGGSGGGGGTLNALSDVVISGIEDGQVLTYSTEIGQWRNEAGGAGSGMTAHALSGSYHTGLLNWTDVNKTGSSLADLAARDHGDLTGISPNQHHNQVHALVSSDHTAAGIEAGMTVRGTSPTTFEWDLLHHTDLDPFTVLPDQHHFRAHDIITGDANGPVHTITGNTFDVVGAVATNTIGLLTPSSNPGATERLLKTSSDGSLFLDTNLLYVDALWNRVAINRATAVAPESGAALDIVVGSNLNDHTQRIKQVEGQLGRLWRIENTDGDELIVLDSVGNLQSGRPGYVSGLTGWQITPGGNAEFNNIWARGELHAIVFVKDEVHAVGGTLLVATAAVVHTDAQIDSATPDLDELDVDSSAAAFPGAEILPLQIVTTSISFSGTTLLLQAVGNIIEINDPPSGPGLYFTPGEILRVKTEVPTGITDLWFVVQSNTQVAADEEAGIESHNRLSVTKKSGTDATIPKGAGLVSWGHPGDGRILMTSDWRSDDGYSPYIDVFTTGTNPWDADDPTAIIPRMRMGQLKGVGVIGVSGISQWGMIAGSDLTNTNSGYLIASNLGIRLHKVPLTLNNGTADTGLWLADGNLRIGENVADDATTGFQFDPATGNLIIGNVDEGNYLLWTQATNTLTVAGSLLVTDPGTTVTQTYVDTKDLYYQGQANAYADGRYTAANSYGNARRIHKVVGTWDNSAGANVMSWSGVNIYMTDGSILYTYDAYAYAVPQRLYLYYNMGAGNPQNLTAKTTAEVIPNPDWILVAILDPGNARDPKASVTVVAGGVYISGGNLFANAITAQHIVAGQVTASHLGASTINVIETAAENSAGTAQNNAQVYGNRRRVVGVGGSPGWGYGVQNSNAITWTNISIHFADGSTQATVNSGVAMSGTSTYYLYVNVATVPPSSLSILQATTITALGVNDVLIATVQPAVNTASGGSGYPTLLVVAGGTYISGDSILTGSIVANNIAASAVTADKINVNSTVAIAAGGAITGGGKTFGAGSGFFLGSHGGTYKLDIGTTSEFLRWDGTRLYFLSDYPISLSAYSGSEVIFFQATGWNKYLHFNEGSAGTFRFDSMLRADGLGMTVQRVLSSWTATGTAGDIAWGNDGGATYLYICYSTNNWRRIQIPGGTW